MEGMADNAIRLNSPSMPSGKIGSINPTSDNNVWFRVTYENCNIELEHTGSQQHDKSGGCKELLQKILWKS